MPRRRADKVIEHRISLSDGLHKEVKQVIASNKISSQVSMVGNGAKSVMNVAAVGAIGAVAYLGVKAYAEAKGVSEQIKGALNKAWDWGFGVETNADGSLVPTTVTTTDAWGNEKVVVNRINEVPVLGRVWPIGGLFQWGMELGAANNPFSGDPAPPPPPPPPRHDADDVYEQYLRDKFYEEQGYHEYDYDEAVAMNKKASDEAAAAWAKYDRENNPDYGYEPNTPIEVEIDVDLTPDATQTGASPTDSISPMNWMAWFMWVDGQGWPNPWGRINKDVDVDGYTVNLSWSHIRYLQFWNANFSLSR
jgi:hypothetical protein